MLQKDVITRINGQIMAELYPQYPEGHKGQAVVVAVRGGRSCKADKSATTAH
jgi:hypothetical protein